MLFRRCPSRLPSQYPTSNALKPLCVNSVDDLARRLSSSSTAATATHRRSEHSTADAVESALGDLAYDLTEARVKGNGSRSLSSEADIKRILPTVDQGVLCGLLGKQRLVQTKGWKVAGYKIGATSEAAQKANGLTKPFWGALYANRTSSAIDNYIERVSLNDDLVRGVEAEFAVTLKKDIPTAKSQRRTPYTAEELRAEYLDTVGPAIEVCASRAPRGAGPYAPLLVADGAGNGCVLLGPKKTFVSAQTFKGLSEKTTSVAIDGVVVATGSGKAVMGSPFESLAWFVNEIMDLKEALNRPALGPELLKGQYVITGATCGLIPLTKPAYVRVTFDKWNENGSDWVGNLALRQH